MTYYEYVRLNESGALIIERWVDGKQEDRS
jgi:hypothetical protein